MTDKRKKLILAEQSRFIMVGILNTIIGTLTMLIAYNIFHMGYWISSALNYIVGSIFSYFANKYFTFQSQKKSFSEVLRFVINILVCYALAYSMAKPAVAFVLQGTKLSQSLQEQFSMFVGMGIFVVLNYFGQKYFVFVKKENLQEK